MPVNYLRRSLARSLYDSKGGAHKAQRQLNKLLDYCARHWPDRIEEGLATIRENLVMGHIDGTSGHHSDTGSAGCLLAQCARYIPDSVTMFWEMRGPMGNQISTSCLEGFVYDAQVNKRTRNALIHWIDLWVLGYTIKKEKQS